MSATSEYQVVVVGAGMVGAAFAAMLAAGGRRVALVEAQPPQPFDAGADYDLRVSAISRASQHCLQNLGVWSGIVGARACAYREMQVWDAGSRGEIHFDAAALGEDCLGHIIENRLIQSRLFEHLQGRDEVDIYCPAQSGRLEMADDQANLHLGDGRVLSAPLLVAADGGRSRMRELMGIELVRHDYHQSGLVCCVATERPHGATARQRFLPGGPLAFLPLSDGRCSIVWSLPSEAAEALCELEPGVFAARLAEALEHRLGEVTDVGPRAAFPLRRQHARTYIAPRFALIGDAAHTIHPLAGQGVNLGLLDAASLAQVLLADRSDWGRTALLRRYERWRRGENEIMLRAMDGFQWLFGRPEAPLRLLRGLGLGLTDRAEPLKHALVRHAMGLSGDLPDLARPAH